MRLMIIINMAVKMIIFLMIAILIMMMEIMTADVVMVMAMK